MQFQERKKQQQMELAEVDQQMRRLEEEHAELQSALAGSFHNQPSRNLEEAFNAWQVNHDKVKDRIKVCLVGRPILTFRHDFLACVRTFARGVF